MKEPHNHVGYFNIIKRDPLLSCYGTFKMIYQVTNTFITHILFIMIVLINKMSSLQLKHTWTPLMRKHLVPKHRIRCNVGYKNLLVYKNIKQQIIVKNELSMFDGLDMSNEHSCINLYNVDSCQYYCDHEYLWIYNGGYKESCAIDVPSVHDEIQYLNSLVNHFVN